MEIDLKDLLDEARTHFKAGDFPKAEERLQKALPKARDYADVHNMLGVIFHSAGKFARALESFQEALRINPGYTEALLNLSVTYNDLGMYDEARAVFARATQASQPTPAPSAAPGDMPIDPFVKGKLANMHADLGDVYAQLLQYGASIDQYQKALQLRADFADIRTSLGRALRDAGRKEDALRELTRAREDQPTYAPAGIQLGITYYSLGRNAEAKKAWEDVLGHDSGNSRAKMFLHLVSEMSGTPNAGKGSR